jgi:hypothetical protein
VTNDLGRTWRPCRVAWEKSSVGPTGGVWLTGGGKGWAAVARFGEREFPAMEGVAATEDGGCTWIGRRDGDPQRR